MDERGYLQITDRKKDMFIVGGFNVYPAEVENADPRASRASRRSRWSACPTTAWARWAWRSSCRAPATTVDADELLAWCAPTHGQLQGAAPRRSSSTRCPVNASGKVLKYELRERV